MITHELARHTLWLRCFKIATFLKKTASQLKCRIEHINFFFFQKLRIIFWDKILINNLAAVLLTKKLQIFKKILPSSLEAYYVWKRTVYENDIVVPTLDFHVAQDMILWNKVGAALEYRFWKRNSTKQINYFFLTQTIFLSSVTVFIR